MPLIRFLSYQKLSTSVPYGKDNCLKINGSYFGAVFDVQNKMLQQYTNVNSKKKKEIKSIFPISSPLHNQLNQFNQPFTVSYNLLATEW